MENVDRRRPRLRHFDSYVHLFCGRRSCLCAENMDRSRPRLRALKPCSLDDIVHAIPLQALCHTQFVIPTDVKRASAVVSARVGRRDLLFLLRVDKIFINAMALA